MKDLCFIRGLSIGILVGIVMMYGILLFTNPAGYRVAKRAAFRVGYKQQQLDNTYGMNEYGFTYFINAYTDAEIDSILEAQ